MTPFNEQVYSIVEKIPCGKVVSYGQIAWILGRPRGARLVGRAMRYCLDCGAEFIADLDNLVCPECGGKKLNPLSGRDLTLKEIEAI